LIRDVMALMITVIIVWVKLSDGVVTHANTTMFFGLYGFFICLVLTADIYHRAVVLPRMQVVAAAVADAEQRGSGGTEELESNPDIATTIGGPPPNVFMQFVTSFSNHDNSNPSLTPMQHQQLGDALRPPDMSSLASQSQTELVAPTLPSSAIGEGAAGTAEFVANEQPFVLHGQNGILNGNNNAHAPPSSTLEMDTDDGGGHYTLVEDHIDRVCVGEGSPGIPSYNWTGACHDGKQEILVELTEIWNEISSSEGELQL
jgi:sodium/potassium/calcium exchanger 6